MLLCTYISNRGVSLLPIENMTVIKRYNPFRDLEKFFEDDFFGFIPAVKRQMEPLMDIYETEKELIAELQVPYMDPSKVHVSIEGNEDEPKILKIEGSEEDEKKEEGKNYYRKEIRTGHFVRMFRLPIPVQEDSAEATYENGILRIIMKKGEAREPKKIDIKVKS